ncbi:MAG: amidohydrolase family protein [Dehalococcoidia bacterium]|nr:amidohydrolase family protein [Dehalococcoidia bacterium]
MKIDIFTHILPPKYKEALFKAAPPQMDIISNISSTPTVYDLDHRFRVMDQFEGLKQVLTIAAPALEEVAGAQKAMELARIANDGLAELVNKYPDRFVAGVASLPMNNPDAALAEMDRAIKDLKLKGVQVLTPTCDKPLDMPEFVPIYAKMAQYDLPVWLHPRRAQSYADYRYEHESKYRIFSVFGWPFETTVAMARIVFSGILEKYPNLKFITHHCGGMVPYFRERVIGSYERIFKDVGDNVKGKLSKPHIEYFRMFYNDTAINGNTSALMCAYEFCGAEHMLFGTDMPFDTEFGARNLRQVSAAIEKMAISEDEKQKIFHGNARKLLRLSG